MATTTGGMKRPQLNEGIDLLKNAIIVFWDFDGVIKDSVMVKSTSFEQLFMPYGREVAERVRLHHEAHSGVSRYQKIPIYLGWVGEQSTEEKIREFCDRFSDLVRHAVVAAPWVPGVREYLDAHHDRQHFVLVTATPQEEIQQILHALGIRHYFRDVYGAPTPKATAIFNVLERFRGSYSRALVVGDSEVDLQAAEDNRVEFLLRKTTLNQQLQRKFPGPSFYCLDVGAGGKE